MNFKNKKKAIFFDRDGVINKDLGYIYKINEFKFIPNIFKILKYFLKKQYLIFIITNQSGIARGYFSENDYQKLTDWMIDIFLQHNIYISKIYHCPHHPAITGNCDCRKPNPGLLFKAQKDFNIDFNQSLLIGDKETDILAGINAGIINNILITKNLTHETQAQISIENIFDVTKYF